MPRKIDANDPKVTCAVMYAKDPSIPRGEGSDNTRMRHFRSKFKMFLFLMTNSKVRPAVFAGRIQIIRLEPRKKNKQPEAPTA